MLFNIVEENNYSGITEKQLCSIAHALAGYLISKEAVSLSPERSLSPDGCFSATSELTEHRVFCSCPNPDGVMRIVKLLDAISKGGSVDALFERGKPMQLFIETKIVMNKHPSFTCFGV